LLQFILAAYAGIDYRQHGRQQGFGFTNTQRIEERGYW
jgi:hypothetical protein